MVVHDHCEDSRIGVFVLLLSGWARNRISWHPRLTVHIPKPGGSWNERLIILAIATFPLQIHCIRVRCQETYCPTVHARIDTVCTYELYWSPGNLDGVGMSMHLWRNSNTYRARRWTPDGDKLRFHGQHLGLFRTLEYKNNALAMVPHTKVKKFRARKVLRQHVEEKHLLRLSSWWGSCWNTWNLDPMQLMVTLSSRLWRSLHANHSIPWHPARQAIYAKMGSKIYELTLSLTKSKFGGVFFLK